MPRLVLFVWVCLLAGSTDAAQFCVATSAELQTALTAAQANGQDDDIRLRAGTFSSASPNNAFSYTSAENFDLTLSGGWSNAGCTLFAYGPASVLDGGDARRVLRVFSTGNGTNVAYSVSRLTFQNGLATGNGGGLEISALAANSVEIAVQHSSFVGNVATSFGGGLSAVGNTTMRIANNLFLGNEAQANFGAAALTVNGGVAYVVNNTILGNIGPAAGATRVGGLRYAGSAVLELANTILWANTDLDLIVQGSHNRYHNNIEAMQAPVPGVLLGEITSAPEFQTGLLNFDPRPRGAQFNGGYATPPGGLAAFDLKGRPRVDAGVVDIGAYEAEVLFYDGFQ